MPLLTHLPTRCFEERTVATRYCQGDPCNGADRAGDLTRPRISSGSDQRSEAATTTARSGAPALQGNAPSISNTLRGRILDSLCASLLLYQESAQSHCSGLLGLLDGGRDAAILPLQLLQMTFVQSSVRRRSGSVFSSSLPLPRQRSRPPLRLLHSTGSASRTGCRGAAPAEVAKDTSNSSDTLRRLKPGNSYSYSRVQERGL